MAVWLVHARTILWIVMLHIQVIQLDVRFEDKGLQKSCCEAERRTIRGSSANLVLQEAGIGR